MGAQEDAAAWKEKQPNKAEYEVKEPTTLNNLESAPSNAVMAYLEEGDGTLWVGNNPYYAADGLQEIHVGGWKCTAEGTVSLVLVTKKT